MFLTVTARVILPKTPLENKKSELEAAGWYCNRCACPGKAGWDCGHSAHRGFLIQLRGNMFKLVQKNHIIESGFLYKLSETMKDYELQAPGGK